MNKFPSIGVSRHRIATDGRGVTTLVAAHGCPLRCRYCLNPQCNFGEPHKIYTVEELYEKAVIDDLYFEATGGGITFGGGEPLLYAEFIAEFVEYTRQKGKRWHINAETSLSVPEDHLRAVLPYIDDYIIDIKDADAEIYKAYTEREIAPVMANLAILAEIPERVIIRTPLIPGYNTDADIDRTQTALRELGFTRFDRFRYQTDIKKFRKPIDKP